MSFKCLLLYYVPIMWNIFVVVVQVTSKMPISEDEFEHRVHSSNPLAYHHYHQQQLQMAMSKAEQRKNNKPIMEKKRRARINNCLNELKSLILDAMKKDPARHSKLEKADILEMTVKHLQSVQKQELSVAMTADPSVVHKFKSGFSECASEVNQFIGRLEGIDAGLKQRLMGHLTSCVTGLKHRQISPFGEGGGGGGGATRDTQPGTGGPIPGRGDNLGAQFLNLQDLNNNRNNGSHQLERLERLQAIGGIQLIPSRLPTGEFAFVLPNSASSGTAKSLDSPNLISEIMNRSHASAFTAVHHKMEPDDPTDDKRSLLSPSSISSSSPVSFHESSTSIGLGGSNDEVTSTSNLDQFKIPHRNFNKSLIKNKSYQTQTSTMKSELLLQQVHRDTFSNNSPVLVKDEDILSKYEDSKRELFTRSFLTPQKFIKPLTVITNNEEKERSLGGGKNPLDYSMKKNMTLNLVQPVDSSQLLSDDKLIRSHYEPLIKIEDREDESDVDRSEIGTRLGRNESFSVHRTIPTSILVVPKDLSQSRSGESFSRKHERSFSDGEKSDTPTPSKKPKLESSEDDGDSPRPKSESSPLSSSTLSTSTLSTSSTSSSADRDSMWRPW